MPYFVYILYSEKLNNYYIGCTSETINQRIRRHLSSHKGFTARAKDWKLAYSETFENKSIAYKREREIKKKKSKFYIEHLIKQAG